MTYQFRYTETNGYKKVHIPKRLHNKLFEYRQIKWCDKYEYYLNEELGNIAMIRLTNLPVKLLMTLCYPVIIILHGLANYKQVNKEIKQLWNQKETGSFSGDDIYRNSDHWDQIMAVIKK